MQLAELCYTSRTRRLAYVPHMGHAVCAGRFSLHRAQVTKVGVAAFHWERRCRVLAREVLRLGTGIIGPFVDRTCVLLTFEQVRERSPPGICTRVSVPIA